MIIIFGKIVKKEIDKKMYFTQSLNIAAYLVFKDFKIENIVINQGVGTFYFERTKDLLKSIEEYNEDQDLKKFIASFRKVKNMIKQLEN